MTEDQDHAHMRRAIALARARLGSTWPNPTVGCVIARGGEVVGEAVTGPGGPDSAAQRLHAEEQALILAGAQAKGATGYITLEPCGERSSGRPSCAERLVAAGVARVLVACADPSPLAAGRGLQRLRAAKIAVETGVFSEAAEDIYAGYRRRLETGLPLVEAAKNSFGFDAEFNPKEGEDLRAALLRFGTDGYTRMWVPERGKLASMLEQEGLLN